jgi:hypothetical protein
MISVATNSGCDCTIQRKKQVDNEDMGSIQREQEFGEHPEWKDITDCSPLCNSHFGPVDNLVVRDVPLEHHWESADGWSKTAQIVQPWGKVKEILRHLHVKSLGKQCGVNKNQYRNKRVVLLAIQLWSIERGANNGTPTQNDKTPESRARCKIIT